LEKAGQLPNSMSDQAIKLILSGKINGTDIKHMRKLISENHLASIDLNDAQIVTGGVSYYSSYKTANNVMGDYAFQGFTKLVSMKLPQTLTQIGYNAFSSSGLKMIDIPDKVTSVGEDAFAYCNSLTTVIVGEKMKTMSKGVFYESKVKDVYVKAHTPPSVADYLFSSKPLIHVYSQDVAKYKASRWAEYGTIVGDLDNSEVVTPIIAIEESRTPSTSVEGNTCYDLMGRRVTNPQPGTIYIQNGKKVIYHDR